VREPRFRWPLWARRAGGYALRGMKHLTIWGVLGMAFLPLYLMLVVSLKDNTQFYEAPAVLTQPLHWSNWSYAWKLITPTLANSVFIATSSTALTLFFALGAAYFFARAKLPLSGFFWNALLVLMMMPAIANLVPLFRLLGDLNLLNTLTALVVVGTAGGQVFAVFVLRNFVADIPQDLFEAAEMDGANHFRQMWVVVRPLSGPILGTVGVMHFLSAWNEFVLPLIIMRDQERLPVMVQLLRLAGEYIKLWGPLMAGYALASLPIIVLFIFAMKLFIRGMTEGAVKG
jgi:ABC-type glycerol-3-phosphate transport system permease component